MRHQSLAAWLAWLESFHPRAIDLGLERVRAVAERLALTRLPCPVITVAGTNGKGSSVAMLEAILSAAGHRVACYTSPHLLRYNERVRIGGAEAGDDALCAAFDRVDQARGDISLTYFEFGTLAALDQFRRDTPDVAVLEVGLGGRLDAVNVIDGDIALVTAIGIDHVEWLGPDREAIAREKAGIFRPGRPAVCADPAPPQSLVNHAAEIGARLYRCDADFGVAAAAAATGRWSWQGPGRHIDDLPAPGLAGRFQFANAAGVLMVLALLEDRLAVSHEALCRGLAGVKVAGRFQRLPGAIPRILDVAHNVDGARALAENLAATPVRGRTLAVTAILGDKDVDGMISSLSECMDEWHVAAAQHARSATPAVLQAAIARHAAGTPVHAYPDITSAYRSALAAARAGDRIVVFGSFYTVGEVLQWEQCRARATPDEDATRNDRSA